ncbi:hypothetical protein [Azohydromonas caseinilytica]|uniref:Uncharacterized protein n=1 Tax=Azohydromonas caseinilytica TaxID=2728836 RepID=A0A848FHP9_9BURK|nr:hypothetical protein [Azohydromonas caseinilytica]NML17783.1 hypothetical protein [Azohydromonas caseinilytica]
MAACVITLSSACTTRAAPTRRAGQENLMMKNHAHDIPHAAHEHGPLDYEQAFEALWQQSCLGRFSVADVKERLHDLKERYGTRRGRADDAPGPSPLN